jgi:hypothetical protein
MSTTVGLYDAHYSSAVCDVAVSGSTDGSVLTENRETHHALQTASNISVPPVSL